MLHAHENFGDSIDDVAFKQRSIYVLRYDWIFYLIRSVPDYSVLSSRPIFQVGPGMVPEFGTLVFALTEMNQALTLTYPLGVYSRKQLTNKCPNVKTFLIK